jgi:hypothetical protein
MKWVRYGLYGVLIWVWVGYFALTALYVSPPNPLKTLTDLHLKTVGKYFYQDWGLFAPNPVQSNLEVHFRCLTKDAVAENKPPKTKLLKTIALPETSPKTSVQQTDKSLVKTSDTEVELRTYLVGSVNATKGLWEAHRHNRFSPYDRLGRSIGNYAQGLVGFTRGEEPLRKLCKKMPRLAKRLNVSGSW